MTGRKELRERIQDPWPNGHAAVWDAGKSVSGHWNCRDAIGHFTEAHRLTAFARMAKRSLTLQAGVCPVLFSVSTPSLFG
jgi:hypothetical protein